MAAERPRQRLRRRVRLAACAMRRRHRGPAFAEIEPAQQVAQQPDRRCRIAGAEPGQRQCDVDRHRAAADPPCPFEPAPRGGGVAALPGEAPLEEGLLRPPLRPAQPVGAIRLADRGRRFSRGPPCQWPAPACATSSALLSSAAAAPAAAPDPWPRRASSASAWLMPCARARCSQSRASARSVSPARPRDR